MESARVIIFEGRYSLKEILYLFLDGVRRGHVHSSITLLKTGAISLNAVEIGLEEAIKRGHEEELIEVLKSARDKLVALEPQTIEERGQVEEEI